MREWKFAAGILLIAVSALLAILAIPADAGSGRTSEAAYIMLPTTPATAPIRRNQGESALYSEPNNGSSRLVFHPKNGSAVTDICGGGICYDQTAFGGMGTGRRNGSFSVVGLDAGSSVTQTPDALFQKLASGASQSYYMTCVATNGTDNAVWRVQGAVKDASGTISALGSAAVLGTSIAPTNSTTDASYWRITPTNKSGDLWAWGLTTVKTDGGTLPGTVVFSCDETTLP